MPTDPDSITSISTRSMSTTDTPTPRTDAEAMLASDGSFVVARDFSRKLERELAAAKDERSIDKMDAYDHHRMCERIWKLLELSGPQDKPCDMILADRLAAAQARAEKAESQVRTLRDALEGVMSTLREGWIPEDVYDTARSALASTAPKP